MYEFWKISTVNMPYTRLQNHTNIIVGEYEIQTLRIVIVVLLLLFDVLSRQVHIPYYFWTSGLSKYT